MAFFAELILRKVSLLCSYLIRSDHERRTHKHYLNHNSLASQPIFCRTNPLYRNLPCLTSASQTRMNLLLLQYPRLLWLNPRRLSRYQPPSWVPQGASSFQGGPQ